jgi:hypothetical protein
MLKEEVMVIHMMVVLIILIGLATPLGTTRAQEGTQESIKDEGSKEQGTNVEGSGFSLFEMESIKGFDEGKVNKDPVCDRSKKPTITKVEPDEAKPGDRITIKGENFGSKECLHSITFSAAAGMKVEYKYVNDTTIEATVPSTSPGMTFVIVVSGAGSAQSKPLLIKGK